MKRRDHRYGDSRIIGPPNGQGAFTFRNGSFACIPLFVHQARFRSTMPSTPTAHAESADPSPPAGMEIRRATMEDATVLAAIGLAVWVDTYAETGLSAEVAEVGLESFSVETVRAIVADATRSVWLAANAAGALGFVVLRHQAPLPGLEASAAELERLYVIERFCRQGTGTRLMQEAIQVARKHGATQLWVDVYSANGRAISFYRKLGFTQHSTVNFRLRERVVPNERLLLAVS